MATPPVLTSCSFHCIKLHVKPQKVRCEDCSQIQLGTASQRGSDFIISCLDRLSPSRHSNLPNSAPGESLQFVNAVGCRLSAHLSRE